MAKKKSKTQKSKKNQKKKKQTQKIKQETTVTTTNNKTKAGSPKTREIEKKTTKPDKTKQLVDQDKVDYNVVITKPKTKTTKNTKKNNTTVTTQKSKNKQLVDVDKVVYNVVLTKSKKKNENNNTKPEKNSKLSVLLNQLKDYFKKINAKTNTKKTKNKKQITKKSSKQNSKNKKKKIEEKPKNIISRIFYEIKTNLHIIFNTILIVTFIILLIGLVRTNAFSKGSIIYISCIAIFLMTVAIGYNKYISGKIFTIIITTAMLLGINHMQYTYDFIRNLNINEYEYKTYYVVTFDNGQNKSIYNINNKKVGLLKNNSTNIQRILNTKLDNINYLEYEDPNKLYSGFYNQEFRAIIVNDNQYKYLKNNIEEKSRAIKILYEFKANGKK